MARLHTIRGISRRIEQTPALWNPLDLDYGNPEVRILHFERIAEAVNNELQLDTLLTGPDVQRRWQGYRGTWSRYQQRFTAGNLNLGDNVALSTLVTLRGVHFLLAFSHRRNGARNLDVRNELDNIIENRMAAILNV